MSHFIVIFKRRDRKATRVERIEDAAIAQRRLFEIEAELKSDPDRDVIMLLAENEKDLRLTHGGYLSVDDLLAAT